MNLSSAVITDGKEMSGLVSVSIMSSANKPNLCTSWPMVIPLISGEERIYSAKGSIARENISGDKGQPCLVPLVKEKFLDSIPVEKMFAVGWVYNAIMAECMNPWKPNLVRVCEIYSQCILSNAFSASNASSREGVLSLCIRLIIFNILLVLSGACLPLTKPTWSGLINKGVMLTILLASILAYILRSEFNKDMGL